MGAPDIDIIKTHFIFQLFSLKIMKVLLTGQKLHHPGAILLHQHAPQPKSKQSWGTN